MNLNKLGGTAVGADLSALGSLHDIPMYYLKFITNPQVAIIRSPESSPLRLQTQRRSKRPTRVTARVALIGKCHQHSNQ